MKTLKNNTWYWLLLPGHTEPLPAWWDESEQEFVCEGERYQATEVQVLKKLPAPRLFKPRPD